MIGSTFQGQEMEIVPLISTEEIYLLNSEAQPLIDESFIDLSSSHLDANDSASVKTSAAKKRKISENSEIKKSSLSAVTPNNPSFSNIKTDMKRILQSSESEMAKYYQIKSNVKLVMIQGNCGEAPYRHHPDTIKELNEYFDTIKSVLVEDESEFNFCAFMKEKFPGLIVKLVQDSQVPQADLMGSLKSILFPVGSGLKEFNLDSSLWEGLVEKVSYGHPEANSNFSAWSCTFWQTKELELLGETIGKHFLTNFVLRNAAKMILESALKTEIPDTIIEDLQQQQQPLPEISLMKIESGTATPKKREKSEKEKEKSSVKTTTSATPISSASIPKISSFFAKLKKPEVVERVNGEYFQPFFVKPDVTLAPINHLRSLKTGNEEQQEAADGYWQRFKKQSVRMPFKKQTCLCVGYDGRPVQAVLKLLKFDENYRPAYLGTWRKSVPSSILNARRPFGRIEEVDYEYESDAEWDEGEDPEGESLSDLDDDEEEDEEEEEDDDLEGENEDDLEIESNRSESADSWLVPHGYLSDDEGVDEVHPGELEEAAREAELIPPKPKQRKNKFIPKEPVLYGPFLSTDQVLPQCLQWSSLQIFSSATSGFGDPFANYDAVFAALETSNSSSNSKKASSATASTTNNEISNDKSVFPEHLLPSMIQIINSNPSAGMTKLYDEFLLLHGKAVSRRLFESKLNQITTGKLKCEKTGKLRWIFKDEHLSKENAEINTSINTINNDTNTIFMQID